MKSRVLVVLMLALVGSSLWRAEALPASPSRSNPLPSTSLREAEHDRSLTALSLSKGDREPMPLNLGSAGLPGGGQQRARRAAKKEESPVTVTRSATLSIPISSDSLTVFSYLADPQKLPLWFPDQAILVAEVGGQYHFRWNGKEGVWSGVVMDYFRGRTLAYTWKPPDETDQTNVRFTLSPQGAETRVELTHSGFTSSESLDKAVKNWDFYLRNLKSVIEQGVDLREAMRRPPARTPARRKK